MPLSHFTTMSDKTYSPGETAILTFDSLPAGEVGGIQLQKAGSGSVALGRTTTGVTERPFNTGNYVAAFIVPAEGDIYLAILDTNDGVLTPETTKVIEITVTAHVEPGETGLGPVADYTKVHLGGETWQGLYDSPDFGPAFLATAVNVVKHQIFKTPPDVAGEAALPVLVLDYVGICVALQLVPAARSYWGSQLISETTGDDPTEIVVYPNRAKLVDDLRDDLMRRRAAAQVLALPLISEPTITAISTGPEIDEDDDLRSTSDPRELSTAGPDPAIAARGGSFVIPRHWERIG